jgi:hypothetical protein
MAGRGTTTFQKRQKEQNRNEKRQEKLARRLQKKQEVNPTASETEEDPDLIGIKLGPQKMLEDDSLDRI